MKRNETDLFKTFFDQPKINSRVIYISKIQLAKMNATPRAALLILAPLAVQLVWLLPRAYLATTLWQCLLTRHCLALVIIIF